MQSGCVILYSLHQNCITIFQPCQILIEYYFRVLFSSTETMQELHVESLMSIGLGGIKKKKETHVWGGRESPLDVLREYP